MVVYRESQILAFMLFIYRGLFAESHESQPQWVVTLIVGMFGPYCSIRFTSSTTGFISQIANRSFNFAARDEEPDLEPKIIWSSKDENEYFGDFKLIYPIRISDLPRTLKSVWIRASWRPAHVSVVWPMSGGWCHIALRPPRGTSEWQYDYGTGRTNFTSPPTSRMPFSLLDADNCPTVVWLEQIRAARAAEAEESDPLASSSRDCPPEIPQAEEVIHVEEINSRISTGSPGLASNHHNPQPTSGFAEYSSIVVDGNTIVTDRQEPLIDQVSESLTNDGPPSVSYLRTLFERNVIHANPGEGGSIHSTNDLFTLEISAPGEEEITPRDALRNLDSPVSMTNVRFISALAFFPRRDSPTNWSDANSTPLPASDDLARSSNQP